MPWATLEWADKEATNRPVFAGILKWCGFFLSRVHCVNGIHSREKGIDSFLAPTFVSFGSPVLFANNNWHIDAYTML